MKLDKVLDLIGLIIHILILIIVMIVLFNILDIYSISIKNDVELWNIYLSVSCFGALISFFLAIDFIYKWVDRSKIFIKNLIEKQK